MIFISCKMRLGLFWITQVLIFQRKAYLQTQNSYNSHFNPFRGHPAACSRDHLPHNWGHP